MIRQPAVAGTFYPGDPGQLHADLEVMIPRNEDKEKVIGIIAPHAGYVYSGKVAGAIYGTVKVPGTIVVLGPNHHGLGARAALYPEGEWLTPLGKVRINSVLADLVRKYAPLVEEDSTAHQFEHSLEVQIPFLQYLNPAVSIVPVCLGFNDYHSCRLLGEGLARAIDEYSGQVLIVASSDMTHYESASAARAKDDLAIREILALNPQGLLQVCHSNRITMCGVVPATVMLVSALGLGATRASLVSYATSGDVTGDQRQVVAYAALTVVG
jgi:AmmeMemoRadiSam system protein B